MAEGPATFQPAGTLGTAVLPTRHHFAEPGVCSGRVGTAQLQAGQVTRRRDQQLERTLPQRTASPNLPSELVASSGLVGQLAPEVEEPSKAAAVGKVDPVGAVGLVFLPPS